MILARAKLSYAPPNLPELWIKRTGYAFESFVELKRSPEGGGARSARRVWRGRTDYQSKSTRMPKRLLLRCTCAIMIDALGCRVAG